MLLCVTMCFSVLCVAMCDGVLPCVAMYDNVLEYVPVLIKCVFLSVRMRCYV
jgi:hypothetical protein